MIEKSILQVKELIDLLQKEYDTICRKWRLTEAYQNCRFNLAKTLVCDLVEDTNNKNFIDYALSYRSFLPKNGVTDLSEFLYSMGCEARIKNVNSIEDKLVSYMSRTSRDNGGSLHGKIPVKKCLNDLFGARCILSDGVKIPEAINIIRETFQHLKSIVAEREGGYRAIHVYLSNSNEFFQWELQIWEVGDESKNRDAHKKYKQKYTKWETSSTTLERR